LDLPNHIWSEVTLGRIAKIINQYARDQRENSHVLQPLGPLPRNPLEPEVGGAEGVASSRFPENGTCQGPLTNSEPTEAYAGLEPGDLEALRGHNPTMGYFLKYDEESNSADNLNNKTQIAEGLLRRLLSSGLIFSNGELTSKGEFLCQDLDNRAATEGRNLGLEKKKEVSETEDDLVRNSRTRQQSTSFPQVKTSSTDRDSTRKPLSHSVHSQPPDLFRPTGPPQTKDHPTDSALVTWLSPLSHEAERFRMLKTCILYPPCGEAPRSIMVTSTSPAEGKSFVAANLAVSVAQNLDRPVLLIDGDLRKPSLHRLFGFAHLPGLTEYLSGSAEWESFLKKTDVDSLYLFPAGSPPMNPSELLASSRMVSLMNDLAKRRELFTVLDSPPAALTADPSILAKLVDGILLVVRYGKTHVSDAQAVVEKLGKEKIIGNVINCYEHSLREYYGYRKYPGYGMQAR
jgi:protein-tyrosine kinase